MGEYSTLTMSSVLLEDIRQALESIRSHGSVEIIVQDNTVTQITVRTIKKTSALSHKSNRQTLSVSATLAPARRSV